VDDDSNFMRVVFDAVRRVELAAVKYDGWALEDVDDALNFVIMV
jgi:hypothetical protein